MRPPLRVDGGGGFFVNETKKQIARIFFFFLALCKNVQADVENRKNVVEFPTDSKNRIVVTLYLHLNRYRSIMSNIRRSTLLQHGVPRMLL